MTQRNLNHPTREACRHASALISRVSSELELRCLVLDCRDWQIRLYEDGAELAGRIAELVPTVDAERVAALAVEAREQMKLRDVALLLVREMARHKTHRRLVAKTLGQVIHSADDLGEFLAIYWKDGRVPLSAQVKKGLAAAFPKFDEHQLAQCDRGGAIQLRDVLFLCHAKPLDHAQAGVWRKLIWGRLTRGSLESRDSKARPEALKEPKKRGCPILARPLR